MPELLIPPRRRSWCRTVINPELRHAPRAYSIGTRHWDILIFEPTGIRMPRRIIQPFPTYRAGVSPIIGRDEDDKIAITHPQLVLNHEFILLYHDVSMSG